MASPDAPVPMWQVWLIAAVGLGLGALGVTQLVAGAALGWLNVVLAVALGATAVQQYTLRRKRGR